MDATAGPRAGVRGRAITGSLLLTAGVGWWWSMRMAAGMGTGTMPSGAMTGEGAVMAGVSLTGYLVGWSAMMVAMMFPAIAPVVALYDRAATRGRTAPTVFFVTGYLVTWSAVGIPAWAAWRALSGPLAHGSPSIGRVAGLVLIVAGVYQLSPLKTACLTQCRSPMGFFVRLRGDLRRSAVAVRAGMQHGGFCLGCCAPLMAVLVAVGTMHLGWMLALSLLVFGEKVLPRGEALGRAAAVPLAGLGVALLASPTLITIVV
jgi:predicted metal-binding membrane protein